MELFTATSKPILSFYVVLFPTSANLFATTPRNGVLVAGSKGVYRGPLLALRQWGMVEMRGLKILVDIEMKKNFDVWLQQESNIRKGKLLPRSQDLAPWLVNYTSKITIHSNELHTWHKSVWYVEKQYLTDFHIYPWTVDVQTPR